MASPPDPLEAAVAAFLLEIYETLDGVVPSVPDEPFRIQADARGRHVAIRQRDDVGIPLQAGGETILTLTVSFRCMWNSEFLAIDQSSFGLWPSAPSNEPLVRFDYLRSPVGGIPSSHIQVHAHRDEAVFAMMMATRRNRGRQRDHQIERGAVPRLQNLHLPTGGPRFRPCIEDVLEFVILEFGIDVRDGHRAALQAGRARYRDRQLGAAVKDNPQVAVDELRRLGFEVEPPSAVPAPTSRVIDF